MAAAALDDGLMSSINKPPATIALIGFASFEQHALESCLRLLARDEPALMLAPAAQPLAQASWIVANADSPDALQEVWSAGRLASTVFIGSRAPDGAGLWLPRPIDPSALERGLRTLAGLGVRSARAPATARAPLPANAAPTARTVLVVDDSQVARQYLRVQLERLGCNVDTASSTDEARAQLAARPYAAVFVDLALDAGNSSELGGLVLCHELHHRPGPRPRVVVVTGRSGGTDRVRASLAGCDSYRVKPVPAAALSEELARLGPAAAGLSASP